MECELPLIGATQGQHNWWTKGLVGSKRTLRNWTGGGTTAKSVAQEGRKVKPILPTTPSRWTDRTTSRTNLTSLKPAEDDFFSFFFFFFRSFFPPEFLLPCCTSFFSYSFFLPSFTLFYSFFLPSFIYSVVLIFVKKFLLILPPIFLYSYSLPSFTFLFPFSLLPFFFFFFLPPFLFFPQVGKENLEYWKDQSKTVLHPWTSAQDQWAQEIKETAPLNPIGILP